MTNAKPWPDLVAIADEALDGVSICQIAALAALRTEMTALSVLLAGQPAPRGHAANDAARPLDHDAEEAFFDNMPV